MPPRGGKCRTVYLDIATLLALNCLTLLLAAAVLILLALRFPNLPGPRSWALGHALVGTHVTLLLLQAHLPAWAGIVLSNALQVAGSALIYAGIRAFLGRRHDWVTPTAVSLLVLPPLLWLEHYPNARIAIVSLGFTTFSWAAAATLASPGGDSVVGRRVIWPAYLMLGAMFVWRAFWAATAPGVIGSFSNDLPNTALLVWNIAYYFLITAGMVLMVSERQAATARLRADELEVEAKRRRTLMGQVAESEAVFRAIVQSAPFAIIVIDLPQQSIMILNSRAADLLDLPEALVAGTAVGTHLDLLGTDSSPLTNALAFGREVSELEVQARRADGALLWLLISATHITLNGQPAAILCLNDISERKALEQNLDDALRHAESALGIKHKAMVEQRNFLALVSHEFRNPLGIIQMSADVLGMREDLQDAAGQETLERIRRGVQRMRKLTEDCLTEEWLDAASDSPEREAVDIAALVRATAQDMLRPDVNMALHISDALPAVVGDRALLSMSLLNIIDNAIKYATPGSVIDVHAEERGEHVVISVRNHGTGIRPDEVERVFEKYYRSPTVGRLPGAGLGLFLVRRIIAAHHGTITLDGEHGHWVAFHVHLPALRGGTPARLEKAANQPPRGQEPQGPSVGPSVARA